MRFNKEGRKEKTAKAMEGNPPAKPEERMARKVGNLEAEKPGKAARKVKATSNH